MSGFIAWVCYSAAIWLAILMVNKGLNLKKRVELMSKPKQAAVAVVLIVSMVIAAPVTFVLAVMAKIAEMGGKNDAD